ncbi:MAG: RNase adapter RapZ [Rubrivivax sp.]|nr:RNase adapter RapZ [Rubrivivax sp.]
MSEWAPLDLATVRDEVVLITGISGSGKSVALHALEDAGYFCVDNLPPELLRDFIRLEHDRFTHRVAVAVDVRTAGSLPTLLPLIGQLRDEGLHVRTLFLDASTDALVRRFSETRRLHPLSAAPASGDAARALMEAIELERELLAELREVATVIDTSQLRPAQLRSWIRSLVGAREAALTMVFESFAFKHGVPLDADYVFDVRVLPNPHYVKELRPLTGRDAPVAAFLEAEPEVRAMLDQIERFLSTWLPAFEEDQRSYLTVAIGCTGGQHRSVYTVEMLARRFEGRYATLVRHRELDARG